MMNKTEIKEILRTFILQELLGRPHYPLADDEPLITGGLIDSFSLAQIGVFVEEAFNVYIPDTDLTVANMDSLNQMAERVAAEIST
jgi:acyl carrier protein